jgi:ribosomal protein S18 acetylase RimI-like enzyme
MGTDDEAAARLSEPRRLNLTDPAVVRELWELQRAAYAVEARLLGFDGIPPLHETIDELSVSSENFLGISDESGLVGAVSWTSHDHGTVEICRLVVQPMEHRRGVATALLDALEAVEPAARTVVSTGTANHPALALYRNRGFTTVGQREVAPGVTVTLLERKARV